MNKLSYQGWGHVSVSVLCDAWMLSLSDLKLERQTNHL